MSRSTALLLLAAIGTACNGAPTEPTLSIARPTAPPAPTRTFEITGTVTESSGAPVEGATVRWTWPNQAPASATTDGQGVYDLVIETAIQFATSSIGIRAEKAGYEANWQYVSLLQNPSQNFRLRRRVQIAAGESIRVEVGPDDSFCGLADEWRCRRVRVFSSRSGTLTLEVVPDNPASTAGLMTAPVYTCCSASTAIVVPVGETQVDVLRPWTVTSPEMLVLSTRLTQ